LVNAPPAWLSEFGPSAATRDTARAGTPGAIPIGQPFDGGSSLLCEELPIQEFVGA
jgi:hypothetical protein